MIREDLDLMDCSLAVPMPVFERVDDGQEFLIMDFVVDFHGLELSGVKRYGV